MEKKELEEKDLKDVTGARSDITIKPSDDEFWHSYNPNFLNTNQNDLGLLNNETTGNVDTKNCEFNGSISNREDK